MIHLLLLSASFGAGHRILHPGETVAEVAATYGMSETTLRALNNLADGVEPAAGDGEESAESRVDMTMTPAPAPASVPERNAFAEVIDR